MKRVDRELLRHLLSATSIFPIWDSFDSEIVCKLDSRNRLVDLYFR
jgi:hypothetical protein